MGNTQEQTNQQLVQGFRKNNTNVLEGIYVRVFPKIKIYVLKNNGNETQAKDIFQDAFIACWKNIKANKLAEDSNVEAYLYRIAQNKWTDYLRSAEYKKKKSGPDLLKSVTADDTSGLDESEEETKRKAMQQALAQLGENCKVLLNLFYFERKSMDAIARTLNLASASARNQKYRCMEKLRKLTLEIKNNG
ncbi:MAG: RNA polymerase sigma factor [Maribacter sp.]|uniref:RNA polymerase sigma factor n=1 Tax=Maribacter sp. 2307UL18-2 TaxID=3386274 RepID=UPI0039BD3C24